MFFAENVYGLLLKRSKSGSALTNMQECCLALEQVGFYVVAMVLCPRKFGKPVHRRRVWIIGIAQELAQFVHRDDLDSTARDVLTAVQHSASLSERELDLDFHLLDETDPLVTQQLEECRGMSSPTTLCSTSSKWRKLHEEWCAGACCKLRASIVCTFANCEFALAVAP